MDTATASALPQVAFEDGLGQRRQIVGAGNQAMTILVLDNDLTALPTFEAALRERIDQLAGFHHPTFARVRGIAHLARVPSSLAVASDHVSGARLSEVLEVAERSLIPLEIEGTYCLLRQLLPAIAALHERQPHGCHGALAPERLIITPGGSLVVVEHVLAAALDQLQFSHERFWRQFRIALPRGGAAPRFDRRADVVQIGTLALALILGRPLSDGEFPDRIDEIVNGVRAISATGPEPLPAGVHAWLRRALQLEGDRSFSTAIEASIELDRVVPADDARYRRALDSFLAQCYAALPQSGDLKISGPAVAGVAPAVPQKPAPAIIERTAPQLDNSATPAPAPVPMPAPAAIHAVPTANPAATPFMKTRPLSEERDSPAVIHNFAPVPSVTVTAPPPVPAASSSFKPFVPEPETPVAPAPATSFFARDVKPAAPEEEPPPVRAPRTPLTFANVSRPDDEDATERDTWDQEQSEEHVQQKSTTWGRNRLAAVGAVVLGIAAVALVGAGKLFGGATTGTLAVNTTPAGVAVVVDGQKRGATPVTIELTPGDHTLTLVSGDQSRTIPLTIAQGSQVSQFIEFPAAPAAAVNGKLQVRTDPPGASVVVDGQPRGNSPLVVDGLAPGVHVVKLENAVGSVTEQVTVEAGATASLVVPLVAPANAPLSGWIAIAAPADVQIFEDQRLIGSSRSERIMMPVGRHELEIVNEPLGYRATRVVQVTPGNTAAVRLDWPKGSMALNAQPWAEVWLDGQRLGETPIGNVQVPIGTHQVVFRHPELGEQAHTVTVTAGRPARVSADLRAR